MWVVWWFRIGAVDKGRGYRFYWLADNKNNRNEGVSLGVFIFLEEHLWDRDRSHEIGHHKQSRILGPLYLIVVGIPSFIRSRTVKGYYEYYSGWPEAWADRLGGVER